MKKFSQFIFNNLGLKIFSLLVAVVVWFFVVIANKPELNFIVPLEFQNIPENMSLVEGEDYEIEVRVRGEQSIISRLSVRQIEVVLDLRQSHPGENVYKLLPHQINLPPGVQAIRVMPNEVKVKLEPQMERLVPVEPVVLGVPAEGYELKEVAVFPKTILVIGAKSNVEALKTIRTNSLNITGFDTSVSEKLGLLPLDNNLSFANGTTSVEVRAIIGEKDEEKQWDIPVKINPVRWKAEIEPISVKVIAIGPISKIRALKATEILAAIDLLELKPEQVQLEVNIVLPEDIVLVRKEPAKVKVISIEKPAQDELQRPTIGGSLP